MYDVSPHPAQAPLNSNLGFSNWLPLTLNLSIIIGFLWFLNTSVAYFCFSKSYFPNSNALFPFLPGQIFTHKPHDVQSTSLTTISYLYSLLPSKSIPLSLVTIGLITACGHTNEHWPHCIQFSLIHLTVFSDTFLFSYCERPPGNVPSFICKISLTFKRLPSLAFIFSKMFFSLFSFIS